MTSRSPGRRALTAGAIAASIAASLTLVVTTLALAHAVVYPKSSATGAFERYVVRVPNERKVATTRVEMTFPAGIRVSSFEEVPGWTIEVARDTAQRIVGVAWTGTLPPERFVELPFVAANPKTAAEIHWPVIQTYADGERVEWTGPAGAKRPASITTIAAGPASGPAAWMAPLALALAVVSLGLALRPRRA